MRGCWVSQHVELVKMWKCGRPPVLSRDAMVFGRARRVGYVLLRRNQIVVWALRARKVRNRADFASRVMGVHSA